MTDPAGARVANPTTHRPARAPSARDARAFAVEAARLIADEKCRDVVCLDVRGLSQVTDFLVIGTGTSDRQMGAVLSHVESLGRERGFEPFRTHADARSAWLLADCVDVVVHLFDQDARAYYDLEMLWGDGERVNWERPGSRAAAGRRRASDNGED